MNKNQKSLYIALESSLLKENFLNKVTISKRDMLALLKKFNWKSNVYSLAEKESISCIDIFEISKKTLEYFNEEPEDGWLLFTHEFIIKGIYPSKESHIDEKILYEYRKPMYIFLEILHVLLEFEEMRNPTDEKVDLKFLKGDYIDKSLNIEEYRKLQKINRNLYIYELLKLSREIMPFDLYSHISGVHYIATRCARELYNFGVDVDVSLVSGAAFTHDIGKFGTKKKEAYRIPYLHYYYTDLFCRSNGLTHISNIASNHSTWDLELENLSAESLLLIYSDFRVKSIRENNSEVICFYTLDEAFNVILSKLDNVDEAKERRYKKVYAKLKDFENYMISLGVNVDLSKISYDKKTQTDVNLLFGSEVVDRLKFMAIDHNIAVMKKFNDEISFANILEMARGEEKANNLRGYLNILSEYHTYMIKSQKNMTLNFLYELLDHREGDIRRYAADLMGSIILDFDEEYRKELPEGIIINKEDYDKFDAWQYYLSAIINPALDKSEQQRRWIGFTLRVFMRRVLKDAKENTDDFLRIFLKFLKINKQDPLNVFILLEALYYVSYNELSIELQNQIKNFIIGASEIDNEEIQIAIYKLTREELGNVVKAGKTVDLFRENLKFNTPWIRKSHNIDVILSRVRQDKSLSLQFATHLSNLLKVCDTVTVRHKAGRALIKIMPLLSSEQRNEIVFELAKGLEIGSYEYSKYIPQYLGKIATLLDEIDLEEFILELDNLVQNSNEMVVTVSLDTVGYILKNYYDTPSKKRNKNIIKKLLGMLLKGLGNFKHHIHQEAFCVIGKELFSDKKLPMEYKAEYFSLIAKKIASLVMENKEDTLTFYYNAFSLNHIYRFVSDYIHEFGTLNLNENDKVAFFPGSFDPFSLGHKEIAKTIRDMGFDVYLYIDEFSWSKKTQPNRIRRNIARISIADEFGIYILPENISINIANEENLKNIEDTIKRNKVYLVVGSDVIQNASSYNKLNEQENTSYIGQMNHIVFHRVGQNNELEFEVEKVKSNFSGDFIFLSLPPQFDDISSTQIRENIDFNRDISYLVDKVAQQYIYYMSIYLREPQFKDMADTNSLRIGSFRRRNSNFIDSISKIKKLYSEEEILTLKKNIDREDTKVIVIRDSKNKKNIVSMAIGKEVSTSELYEEFEDLTLTRSIRNKVRGKILIISNLLVFDEFNKEKLYEITLTELLAEALKDDFTYAIYNPIISITENEDIIRKTLNRSGFSYLEADSFKNKVMSVDMRNPVVLIENVNSVLKAPFKKSKTLKNTLEKAHKKLKEALQILFPDTLILSLNSTVMENKMIKLVKNSNPVDKRLILKNKKVIGANMCVPIGQSMKSIVIPNTATKALHTDKIFDRRIKTYSIKESNYYPVIDNQVRTLKAFNRPIIILDDLLHKGYRITKLTPAFKKHNLSIKKIVAGLISADGRDLAKKEGLETSSAYFLPNLQAWFSEIGQYPYIGGDALVESEVNDENNKKLAINLILPYCAPLFLKSKDKDKLYYFSMVCMENSKDIMVEIEKVYQNLYQKKLTLNRLSEVFNKVFIPDGIKADIRNDEKSPSHYIEEDINRLYRLKGLLK